MENFSFAEAENEPVKKERVVEIIKSKEILDEEAITLLEKFTLDKEEQYQQEGRKDAHLESLREKAHLLNLAGFILEAIDVMNTVAEIAHNEGDEESHNEALWIISKLRLKIPIIVGTREPIQDETSENSERVLREQVLEAFRKLTGKKTDPADLDGNDPEVAKANTLLNTWSAQQDVETKGNEDAEMRHNFEKTILFIEAGFHDPEYLWEVLGWLLQDADNATKDVDNPKRKQLRDDMAMAIRKIRGLLSLNVD